MKKSSAYIPVLAAALLCAVSCVYPFNPEIPSGAGGMLVIEGDILIGEISPVSVTYTAPLSNTHVRLDPVSADVWVEDDRGGIYEVRDVEEGVYNVDMTGADPSLQYRLHVINKDNSKEYVSAFGRCCSEPVIDSLSYIIDEERGKLNIALSMHARDESYFRWSYVEDWEYHAYFNASIKYIPPEMSTNFWGPPQPMGPGSIEPMFPESTYYCWGHHDSDAIMIFSTEKQNDDRFVDLEFLPIARDDRKISSVYHIEVRLEPLTRDAYLYWDNMRTNSAFSADLFTPTPSDMVGNISCVQDGSEQVLGFINVARRAKKRLYVDNAETRFYRKIEKFDDPVELSQGEWYHYYSNGYLPYYTEIPGNYSTTYWALRRCVDCTVMGGTVKRPSWWLKDE